MARARNSSTSSNGSTSLSDLLLLGVIEYEPITYEDFLPLSAGGTFNSNLGTVSKSKQLITDAEPDLDGFQRSLGVPVTDEFKLYEQMQGESMEQCGLRLGMEISLDH